MENQVAVLKCENYNQENVDKAVLNGFNLLGGIEKFVKSGQRVALKVNLVSKATPQQAVTTHPSVVLAVAKLVKEAGGVPFIVDSAGGAYNASAMQVIYKASGMTKLNEEYGIEINDNYNEAEVEVNGKVNKKMIFLDALEKTDVIFNLCKLKTHGFTGISNAVKNMFGAIPGLLKVEYHGKFQNLTNFNNCLFDIHNYYGNKLCIHISDAVVGMEGAGPTQGTPRQIGAIIMGQNPAQVDVIGCRIMNVDPLTIPTIKCAVQNGLLKEDLSFEVLGENVGSFVVADYKSIKPNDYTPFASSMPKFLQIPLNRWLTQRPVIPSKKCKGCGKCATHCPMKAIEMQTKKKSKVAKIDYMKCIRCYCCQELCPFGVVKIKSGWLYKLRHRKDKKQNNK